jgi:hypothetical protein
MVREAGFRRRFRVQGERPGFLDTAVDESADVATVQKTPGSSGDDVRDDLDGFIDDRASEQNAVPRGILLGRSRSILG